MSALYPSAADLGGWLAVVASPTDSLESRLLAQSLILGHVAQLEATRTVLVAEVSRLLELEAGVRDAVERLEKAGHSVARPEGA